jgi:hypothetical protein
MSKKKPVPKVASKVKSREPAKKLGRPTKYTPGLCETVVALGLRGRSKAQMARELNVARSTLDAWCGEHEEFASAYAMASDYALAFWEDIGESGVGKGHLFNHNAWSLQVRNRFPRDYKESRELEVGGLAGSDPIKLVIAAAEVGV